MLVESQPAWLLHARKYTDSRILVDFLTRDHGRISGVARLPRRKKQRASVLSFTPYLISWRGRSQLKTITACEALDAGFQLTGKSLYCGFYLNEVLLRALVLEDECRAIFALYHTVLESLVESQSDGVRMEVALRIFELNLVQALGFGLNFENDVDGHAIEPRADAVYRLADGQGFVPVAYMETGSSKLHFSGDVLCHIAQRSFNDSATLKAAKIICRMSLRPLIGDKPLQSREFFRG